MIETQCEQIAFSYQIFLNGEINIPVSTNVVTRRDAVVTGPLGPPEYEAEKERREKALLEASQEDDTLLVLKMKLFKKHKTQPWKSKMMLRTTIMTLMQTLSIQEKKMR